MNEQYFGLPREYCFHPSLLMRLKFWLKGERIVEIHGCYYCEWYLYNGVLYMTRYSGGGL